MLTEPGLVAPKVHEKMENFLAAMAMKRCKTSWMAIAVVLLGKTSHLMMPIGLKHN